MNFSIVGNCQSLALAKYLNENKIFKEMYKLDKIKPVHVLNSDDIASFESTISTSDLVIYQKISDGYKNDFVGKTNISNLLSKDTKTITFPSLYFDGYFPHLASLNGVKSILKLVHDYNIVSLYLKGMSAKDVIDTINSNEFYSKSLVTQHCEQSIDRLLLKAKIDELDIDVSEFILNNYRQKRIFHQFNHPTRSVFKYIVDSISQKLELNIEFNTDGIDHLNEISTPIYPSIYKHLGLSFQNQETFNTIDGVKDIEFVVNDFIQTYKGVNKDILINALETKPFINTNLIRLGI